MKEETAGLDTFKHLLETNELAKAHFERKVKHADKNVERNIRQVEDLVHKEKQLGKKALEMKMKERDNQVSNINKKFQKQLQAKDQEISKLKAANLKTMDDKEAVKLLSANGEVKC